MVNAAIYETNDKTVIKKNTLEYYKGDPINISPFKLALGSAFMPDVRLDDHSGKVHTATYGSINRYLNEYDLVQKNLTVVSNSSVTIKDIGAMVQEDESVFFE